MKRILFGLILGFLSYSCGKGAENMMLVSGTIDGLKKGTLYFQKIQDSTLINLDSLEIRGDGSFTFTHEIESPEVFYLYLDKADNNTVNDRITFFGEKGAIQVKTSWNTFDSKAEITGSKAHEEYEAFQEMISKFNTKDLELAQTLLRPEIQKDTLALDSLQRLIDRNIVGKYRYVLNFGLNNTDSYITPYVALTQASDANPKYLDSIANQLAPEVAASKYGKALKGHLERLKD